MNTAEPLIISIEKIRHIKKLAAVAGENRECERTLYLALKELTVEEQAELLALVMLGRAGHDSFNVALASAKRQNPEHIAGMLAEKSNFATHLAKGLNYLTGRTCTLVPGHQYHARRCHVQTQAQ